MEWLAKNKGILSVILTVLTLGGSILYKVAKIEGMSEENTEYRKESEKARHHFEVEFAKMMVLMERVLEVSIENKHSVQVVRDDFDEYKDNQERIIREFYHLNKNLKDPRLHTQVVTIPPKFIKYVTIHSPREAEITEYCYASTQN